MAAVGVSARAPPLAHDYDPDSDALTVVTTGDPVHGGIGGIVRCADDVGGSLVSPQGTSSLHPRAGFVGVDQFTYTISDGRGGTARATYYIAMDDPDLTLRLGRARTGAACGRFSLVIPGTDFVPGVLAGFVCNGACVRRRSLGSRRRS